MPTLSPSVLKCAGVALFLTLCSISNPPVYGQCASPSNGPDVIVGDLAGWSKWGTVGTISAYSLGATSCNIGNQVLPWIADSNQHPVIATNAYRMKNGRFEQLGMSWLKHGWGAATDSLCCTCINPQNFEALGVGCSDPYDSGLNGDQDGFMNNGVIVAGLGPRYEVDASSGTFVWPYATRGQNGNAIYKRLQIQMADLDPAQNVGALYFAEVHYVTPHDAAAGNKYNNASYRRFLVGTLVGGSYTLAYSGTYGTQRMSQAIQAWKDNDASVTLVNIDIPTVDVPALDGRYVLGCKTTNNGNGTWHYEYALYNMNSHRSCGSFSLPMPAKAAVTNIGFHDVDYHSGDGNGNVTFDGTDWPGAVAGGSITWATTPYPTNANANALRWGTLYNYRFDADLPPGPSTATLGLFRPGTPASMPAATRGPVRLGDTDGNGAVDVNDLLNVINAWGPCPAAPATCWADVAPPGGNGVVDVNDLLMVIANWG